MPSERPRRRLQAMKRSKAKGVAMFTSRKFFEWGGIAASIILVAFGIASIVVGVNGRSTVRDSLKQQAIVGTPDLTPAAINAEALKAGLPTSIVCPKQSAAEK